MKLTILLVLLWREKGSSGVFYNYDTQFSIFLHLYKCLTTDHCS